MRAARTLLAIAATAVCPLVAAYSVAVWLHEKYVDPIIRPR